MQLSRLQALGAIPALALSPTLVRSQPAPLTVRVASTNTEYAVPLEYAQRTGIFERAGLKVEASRLGSGAAIAAGVVGGALDIGNSSILGLVLGHAHGVPFTIIGSSGVWLPGSEGGLVVASSSTLRTPKDFVGKTITAAAVNDINGLAMEAWMDQGGADPKSFKTVEIPQMAAIAALEQGRVDGITITNPAYATAMATGKTRLVANIFSAISPRFLLVVWISTTSWVERNRPAAERFVRAINEASLYLNAHPEETLGDLVEFTGLDRSIAAKMKRATLSTTVLPGEVQPVIDVAAKYKVIDKPFPAADLITDVAGR